MLALLALLAAGPASFLEKPLPGVQIGPITPFTGKPATNYLQSDLNADGFPDLVLQDGLMLQQGGGFPDEYRSPLPPSDGYVEADVFGHALYFRTANRLTVYTVAEGGWRPVLDQPLDWPGARDLLPLALGRGPAVTFRRFVYDVDGDDTPELIDIDGQGLHVFRQRNGRYETAGLLNVFPAMLLSPSSTQEIWPANARRIVLPDQQLSCRLLVEKNALTLLTHLGVSEDKVTYQQDAIALHLAENGNFTVSDRVTAMLNGLPAFVRPCHLNGDPVLDFAGGRWLLSETTPIPMPIYEIWATLDGGATYHVQRAPCFQHFRPHCTFLDFDSDGDMDLVTESTLLYQDGVRETMNRYLTERRLPHRIEIYPQDANAFSKTAAVSHTVYLALESPPIAGGAMITRYEAGKLINLTGDFNGDGYLDLAARTAPARLCLYLADGWKGFGDTPSESIAIPENADFAVADLNGDGLADLLLNWEEERGDTAETETAAYFTKRVTR